MTKRIRQLEKEIASLSEQKARDELHAIRLEIVTNPELAEAANDFERELARIGAGGAAQAVWERKLNEYLAKKGAENARPIETV